MLSQLNKQTKNVRQALSQVKRFSRARRERILSASRHTVHMYVRFSHSLTSRSGNSHIINKYKTIFIYFIVNVYYHHYYSHIMMEAFLLQMLSNGYIRSLFRPIFWISNMPTYIIMTISPFIIIIIIIFITRNRYYILTGPYGL